MDNGTDTNLNKSNQNGFQDNESPRRYERDSRHFAKPFWFCKDSQGALEKAINEGDRLYFSLSTATDVYYLVRRQTGSKETALNAIKQMAEFLVFAEVDGNCILAETLSKLNDFEDAVVDAVASKTKVDIILTINVADFKSVVNKVITPSEFIQ